MRTRCESVGLPPDVWCDGCAEERQAENAAELERLLAEEAEIEASTKAAHEAKAPDHQESIAEEAHRLVHGPRRSNYGHPADDYARTVGAFNALTGRDLTIGEGILYMQLVKLSRQRHTPKRDNLVDLCGYALCEQMVVDAGRWGETP